MSLDRSLKSANALIRHRNVLTRKERLDKLAEDGKWNDKKSVFGLPKVGHRKVETAKAVKEVVAEGAEGAVAGAAPAAGGAKPAASGAKPAAGAAAPKAGAPAAKAAAPAAKKK